MLSWRASFSPQTFYPGREVCVSTASGRRLSGSCRCPQSSGEWLWQDRTELGTPSVRRDIFAIQIEQIDAGETETASDACHWLSHHAESIDRERGVFKRCQSRSGRSTDRVSRQHRAPAGEMQWRAEPLYGGQFRPKRFQSTPIALERFSQSRDRALTLNGAQLGIGQFDHLGLRRQGCQGSHSDDNGGLRDGVHGVSPFFARKASGPCVWYLFFISALKRAA